jgi:predicted dehydrogenase
MIWDGAIGDVGEVHAWTSATRWNKGLNGRPADESTPEGVNWDLWLGPREARAYSSAYNAVRWRDFWDFGTALIGDFFCHNFDPAFWALDLRNPLSIEASTDGPVDPYIAPASGTYIYEFGPRENRPAVKFTWYEGGLKPARPAIMEPGDQFDGNGILFIGNKGMLSSPGWGGRAKLLPGSKDKEYQRPKPTLVRSKGHHRDWLDACKGGPSASSNFAYGAALTEVGLLGLVAMRLGKKAYWDAKAMKFTNAPETDVFLKELYRPRWGVAA